MADLWEKLRQQLDQMSTGFPSTESGIEIEILKDIFTEEEAALFLDLTPFPETPEAAAERLGRDEKKLGAQMEKMAKKGQLLRVRKDGVASYSIVPFVVGLMEFQVKRLADDKILATKMEQYAAEGFIQTLQSLKTPHQRTIPVTKDLVVRWPVAPYEDAITILKNQKKIALAPCVCRQLAIQARPEETLCKKPLEACLIFGQAADYYVENGMGRFVSVEEAEQVIKRSEEAGLVVQPVNAQKVAGMCNCCGDCCGMLMSLKMQPKPAEAVQSNYYAEVDPEECTACETCLDRCQMEAIEIPDDTAVVLRDRCVGCGLCVTICPTEAVKLVKKPEDELYQPPKTGAETYMKIMQERGKL